jgi:hypothetical protein
MDDELTYEELLDICDQHRVYAQYYRGRWFIALGCFFGFGKTLQEAIENWCKSVEKQYE